MGLEALASFRFPFEFSQLTLPRGCVTGAQIKHMRDYLLDPATDEYRWDALDGYDSGGAEKNSLEKHPDLQEKVRRVIEQGFIDPEDWNGVSFPFLPIIYSF